MWSLIQRQSIGVFLLRSVFENGGRNYCSYKEAHSQCGDQPEDVSKIYTANIRVLVLQKMTEALTVLLVLPLR